MQFAGQTKEQENSLLTILKFHPRITITYNSLFDFYLVGIVDDSNIIFV